MNIVSETEFKFHNTKKVVGHFCECADGSKIFLAAKKHGNLFRSNHKSISGAMTAEVCGWILDERILFTARARGCAKIGVRTTDTKDIYLAEARAWFDRKLYREHTESEKKYTTNSYSKRLLYLSAFEIIKAEVELSIKRKRK